MIILATALSGVTAFLVSKNLEPVYQTSTMILIAQSSDNKANEYTAILTSERLSQTYSNLIISRPILENVIRKLRLDTEYQDLIETLDVQTVRDTQLIKLDVEDSDPARAAQIANTIVDEFIQYIQGMQSARYTVSKQNPETQMKDLNQQIQAINQDLAGLVDTPDNQAERDRLEANLIQYRQSYTNLLQSYEEIRMFESQSTTEVIQVEVAVLPEKPIRPRVIVNALLAAVVGGMLAIGAVFFIEALDDTIKNLDEIGRLFNLPVLGIIFRHDTSNGKPISIEKPPAQVTDAFRSLRANIQYASVDKPIHSLMVTGPTPDVGKTTLSANLAIVLSQVGSRVVLVDTDLRRPDLHKLLNLPNRQGLSGLFIEPELRLDEFLQKDDIPGLAFLCAGDTPPNPAELINSGKMTDILNLMGNEFDIAVIDSAPVLAVSGSLFLSLKVDATLLVVKPGVTTRVSLKQAIEKLNQVGAKIIRVVFNDVVISRASSYYYSHKKCYGRDSGDGRKGYGKKSSGSKRLRKLFSKNK